MQPKSAFFKVKVRTLHQLLDQAKAIRHQLSESDSENVDRLLGAIETAMQNQDEEELSELEIQLDDLLFYLAE